MLLLAPVLSVLAMILGGVASIVAVVLNGPRRLRERGDPPIVVLPPVPTPEMRRLLDEADREPALVP